MAQKTNLNVSPYYDDFDSLRDFYKVLFNPGRPVQARELTTLQSILQNQIENFGSNLFKDGSVVVPGNIVYDGEFYAVKLNSSLYGTDISLYLDKLIGKKIIGQSSGVSATVQYILYPSENTNIEYTTIYVKYSDSDNDFKVSTFSDGELLECTENIVYGSTTINTGTAFASLVSSDANSIGSAASIGDGIYFIRGFFARVAKQTIILDEYTNTPSYRVGLRIFERIVTAKDDSTLYDNAKGFSNYAAPGADRLKIELILIKKDLDDINEQLEAEGISVEVINLHTIKPFDEAAIIKSLKKTGCVVTAEEHNVIGGMGDVVAQAAAKHYPVPVEFIGTQDTFGESGTPNQLLTKYGLDAVNIVAAAKKVISRKK